MLIGLDRELDRGARYRSKGPQIGLTWTGDQRKLTDNLCSLSPRGSKHERITWHGLCREEDHSVPSVLSYYNL